MTPESRSAAVAVAKSKAVPVASCVAARLRPDHLGLRQMSQDELIALVLVLAAAADPVALRAVVAAPDDGYPDASERNLKAAHAECNRLRAAKQPVPTRVALLEAEYQRTVPRAAAKPAGLLAQIRSDEAKRRAEAAKEADRAA